MFRSLLKDIDPEVHLHLQDMGIEALELAFSWLFSGFVNHLQVSQATCGQPRRPMQQGGDLPGAGRRGKSVYDHCIPSLP